MFGARGWGGSIAGAGLALALAAFAFRARPPAPETSVVTGTEVLAALAAVRGRTPSPAACLSPATRAALERRGAAPSPPELTILAVLESATCRPVRPQDATFLARSDPTWRHMDAAALRRALAVPGRWNVLVSGQLTSFGLRRPLGN